MNNGGWTAFISILVSEQADNDVDQDSQERLRWARIPAHREETAEVQHSLNAVMANDSLAKTLKSLAIAEKVGSSRTATDDAVGARFGDPSSGEWPVR